ncbi:MAG: nucleotidyltransferase family protein, partial [Oscillospiraceae bacterium]|nr:nucleotidyltransferase family protein [Oscillospiraceae bacterium]
MTVAVIASEYNPFHNGHAHHIAETRAAGATHIVAVMSGNFTQRGTPAAMEKRVRAKAALMGGADVVL